MDRPFRIVVTDRNRHVRAFVRRELAQDGYEVMEAVDYRELQKILGSSVNVDLLVLDPDIAVQSLRVVLRTLKQRYPTMRVVAHSFWDDAALAHHVDASVTKTGSPRELKEVVSRLLATAVAAEPKDSSSPTGPGRQIMDKEGDHGAHSG
ncbi:hypothetical protein [Desulfosoma sp.]|uniref:hypothetical protein n=1 Tax=Desulfosoma sp. TaxID=2603217 RepID=UPI00404B4704